MAVSQFGNVPLEVVNNHLIIVSKVGFYDIWISEMKGRFIPSSKDWFRYTLVSLKSDFKTFGFRGGHRNDDSFKPLLFRRWGSNLDSHRKLVFSYQGMDNLFIPFKGSGKTPLPLS